MGPAIGSRPCAVRDILTARVKESGVPYDTRACLFEGLADVLLVKCGGLATPPPMVLAALPAGPGATCTRWDACAPHPLLPGRMLRLMSRSTCPSAWRTALSTACCRQGLGTARPAPAPPGACPCATPAPACPASLDTPPTTSLPCCLPACLLAARPPAPAGRAKAASRDAAGGEGRRRRGPEAGQPGGATRHRPTGRR